jgi:hypothetical protein
MAYLMKEFYARAQTKANSSSGIDYYDVKTFANEITLEYILLPFMKSKDNDDEIQLRRNRDIEESDRSRLVKLSHEIAFPHEIGIRQVKSDYQGKALVISSSASHKSMQRPTNLDKLVPPWDSSSAEELSLILGASYRDFSLQNSSFCDEATTVGDDWPSTDRARHDGLYRTICQWVQSMSL